MFLIDTNIFLEILLEQEKKEDCEKFLNDNMGDLSISDFSLHSIGVILFRNECQETFTDFIIDVLPNVRIVSLPLKKYPELEGISSGAGLDFDDLYQYSIAKALGLELVTLDHDFNKVKNEIDIIFI